MRKLNSRHIFTLFSPNLTSFSPLSRVFPAIFCSPNVKFSVSFLSLYKPVKKHYLVPGHSESTKELTVLFTKQYLFFEESDQSSLNRSHKITVNSSVPDSSYVPCGLFTWCNGRLLVLWHRWRRAEPNKASVAVAPNLTSTVNSPQSQLSSTAATTRVTPTAFCPSCLELNSKPQNDCSHSSGTFCESEEDCWSLFSCLHCLLFAHPPHSRLLLLPSVYTQKTRNRFSTICQRIRFASFGRVYDQ